MMTNADNRWEKSWVEVELTERYGIKSKNAGHQ